MDLSLVLQKAFGINSIDLVVPVPADQRAVKFADGSEVELPENLRLALFVVKRDGKSQECIDALGNAFRVTVAG